MVGGGAAEEVEVSVLCYCCRDAAAVTSPRGAEESPAELTREVSVVPNDLSVLVPAFVLAAFCSTRKWHLRSSFASVPSVCSCLADMLQ